MVSEYNKSYYNKLKEHQDKKYSGMTVGASHDWNYTNARWQEKKEDVIRLSKSQTARWGIKFSSIKQRRQSAPKGSGAKQGSIYQWLIIATQTVQKLDENRYETLMTGDKYQLGYKKPNWKQMSHKYEGQLTENQMKREIINHHLKETLKRKQEEVKTKYV